MLGVLNTLHILIPWILKTTMRLRQGAIQEWNQDLEHKQYGSGTYVLYPSATLPLSKELIFNSSDVLNKEFVSVLPSPQR